MIPTISFQYIFYFISLHGCNIYVQASIASAILITYFLKTKDPSLNAGHLHYDNTSMKRRDNGVVIEGDFNFDDYSSSILFVGMDCEMVGVGPGGIASILARCTLITLVTDKKDHREKVKVLYDVHVKPTKKVTDYRTKYSGITYKRLKRDDVITFDECKANVLRILSTTANGRKVVLVGHALENDFLVLQMSHPEELIRDTAWYQPFMRRKRKDFYPKKLSKLTRKHLGVTIQNNQTSTLYDNGKGKSSSATLGHDSIEDSAAAMMLYKKFSYEWESGLDFPLRDLVLQHGRRNHSKAAQTPQAQITFYLDCRYLPINIRRRKDYSGEDENQFQLLSPKGENTRSQMDWTPHLHTVLELSSYDDPERFLSGIGKIRILYDAKMMEKQSDEGALPSTTYALGENLYLDPLKTSLDVHGALVSNCISDRQTSNISLPNKRRAIAKIDDIINEFNDGLTDNALECSSNCKYYYIVRRKTSSAKKINKTNKKLFDELCIRPDNKGAFCLVPSLISGNSRLHKYNIQIAKKLQRAKVNDVIEYERRLCQDVRSIVVTDDVLLSDQVVKEGGVVMRYSQLRQLL